MFKQETFVVEGYDQIDPVKNGAAKIAAYIGFSKVCTEEISIVVSELATNIVKFAQEGKILICPFIINEKKGIDIIALDNGQGIYDTDKALRDGFSTSASLGSGLGAIKRLTDEFDLFSLPKTMRKTKENFTIVFARKWLENKNHQKKFTFESGMVTRPFLNEEYNGDDVFIKMDDENIVAAVFDGIGHGPDAAKASQTAVSYLQKNYSEPIDMLLHDLHPALAHTRGAVAAIAHIDKKNKKLFYGGIGNISARVVNSPVSVHPVTLNGTLGAFLSKIKVFQYDWIPGSVLIMTSDGISNRWDINDYPDLNKKHPAVIAHTIFHFHARTTDDATILTVK